MSANACCNVRGFLLECVYTEKLDLPPQSHRDEVMLLVTDAE